MLRVLRFSGARNPLILRGTWGALSLGMKLWRAAQDDYLADTASFAARRRDAEKPTGTTRGSVGRDCSGPRSSRS